MRRSELTYPPQPLERWTVDDGLFQAGYIHVTVDRIGDDLAGLQRPGGNSPRRGSAHVLRESPIWHSTPSVPLVDNHLKRSAVFNAKFPIAASPFVGAAHLLRYVA